MIEMEIEGDLGGYCCYIGWHTRSWTILNCKKTHLASTQVNTMYMLMYIFLTKFYRPNFIGLPQLLNLLRPIERHHPKFAYFERGAFTLKYCSHHSYFRSCVQHYFWFYELRMLKTCLRWYSRLFNCYIKWIFSVIATKPDRNKAESKNSYQMTLENLW